LIPGGLSLLDELVSLVAAWESDQAKNVLWIWWTPIDPTLVDTKIAGK